MAVPILIISKRELSGDFPDKIEFVDGNEGALRELIRRMEKECDTIRVKNGANDAVKFSKTDRVTYYFSGKQISGRPDTSLTNICVS